MTRRRRPSRPRLLGAGLLALVAASLVGAGTTGGAAPAGGPEDPGGSALPVALPEGEDSFRAHVDLAEVEVEGQPHRRARDAYDEVADGLRAAQRRHLDAEARLTDLAAARERTAAELAVAEARRAAAARRIADLDAAIADLAVESFIGRDELGAVTLADDPALANEAGRRRVLTSTVIDSLVTQREVAEARLAAARSAAGAARAAGAETAAAQDSARAELDRSRSTEAELSLRIVAAREGLERARAVSTVAGVDFPLVALDAYHRAALTTTGSGAGCEIEWWALAGVSRVEGGHGSSGGARLEASGDTSRPIVGIPLDGRNDTAVIGDTDGGAIDGDPTVDRAVGPMQFIPGTWRRFARDGNGDGRADPHNLYDAALAASEYLCRASGQLTTDPGLRAAFLSYNRSLPYVENVLGHARRYEAALTLDGDQD